MSQSHDEKHSPTMDLIHRITNAWFIVSTVLELLIAFLVTIAIIVSMIRLAPDFLHLFHTSHVAEAFTEYLEELFTVVVGIEFLKMLCHPNSDNILETLIFLIARHMILSVTTPLEDLISVFTVILLVTVRHYMKHEEEFRNRHRLLAGKKEKE